MVSEEKELLSQLQNKYKDCRSIYYSPGKILHDKILRYMAENGYTTRQPVIDKFIRERLKENGV